MKKLLLLPLLFITVLSFGQAPIIEWHNTYDYGYWHILPVSLDSIWSQSDDIPQSIDQTSDGGYIVAGISEHCGDTTNYRAYWVMKLDNIGNISWEKPLGGGGIDYAKSIQQTSDGGYIVTGWSTSPNGDVTGNHGDADYWIVKLDNVGNIIWEKSLGGSGYDGAQSIQQISDGGYIVAGHSFSNDGDVTGNHGSNDYWIVKLDNVGNMIWEKSLGGSGSDHAYSIQQTTDGGYIVAGSSSSNDGDVGSNIGNDDYWIVKLDNSGNLIWEKSLGGSSEEVARSVAQTADGGYIVAGYSMSNNGDISSNISAEDYWIVKLDAVGNLTWEKSLGGSLTDEAYSIQQTADGGYIATGKSLSNDGDVIGHNGYHDCWVVKLDAVGNLSWQKPLGGGDFDYGYDIKQTSDGGYIVAATLRDADILDSDFSVFKLGPDLVSVEEYNSKQPKELIKIINLLGQEVEYTPNTILIYQYSNGTSEKVFTLED